MPFGRTNAPATFQRLMESAMGDLYLNSCLLYLDDIVVFSRTYEEHLEKLQKVFQRLEDKGLKLKPSKCKLFQKSIKYLGHIVSEDGVATDPGKIKAVKEWPIPSTAAELHSFLGFVGFYRRFIPQFAKVAKPLQDALFNTGIQNSKKGARHKAAALVWGPEQHKSFLNMINLCTTSPVLTFADISKPFKLYTDASMEGLGAVLYQEHDGKDRVVSYASRRLSKSERNYPVHKLEFLALKWAVTEKFADYSHGTTFSAFTDNNPLTYVFSSAKLDATGHRWVAQLANFEFTIHYRSGKQNVDADALSRINWPSELVEGTLSSESVQAVLQGVQLVHPAVETVCCHSQVIPDGIIPQGVLGSTELEEIDWAQVQRQDPILSKVIQELEGKITLPRVDLDHPSVKQILRVRKQLEFQENILCRSRVVDGEVTFPMVLPESFRKRAMIGCHDEVGHMGGERTLSLLRERFFWPCMTDEVEKYLAQCHRCLRRKAIQQRASLVNITTTQPLEMVCIDFLSLEPSKGGIENVLVITDHFTRYAQAFPTKNQTTKTTARILFEHYIVHYGFPERIHSNQGRNFESDTIKHLCELANVKKSRTTPYHPMGNGQVERFNQTLLNMLGTLEPAQKADWKKYVPALTHAYNATRHESTGFTPYFLMFGRNPRLPVDLVFRRKGQDDGKSYTDYVDSLKKQLEYAYSLASAKAEKAGMRQRENYDRKVRGCTIQEGDRVMVRNVGLRGKRKIADRWEDEVYVVVGKPNADIPVYEVEKEAGRKGKRILHRNLLFPINTIPARDDVPVPEPRGKVLPSRPRKKVVTHIPSKPVVSSSEDSDSETESSVGPFLRSYNNHIPDVPLPIQPVELVEPIDQVIVDRDEVLMPDVCVEVLSEEGDDISVITEPPESVASGESSARSEGRSVETPTIDLDNVENVNDDNVDNDYDNDLHVEDSPVTVRQSGRVRRKSVWMGENYQMLHSVPADSGSMWNQRVNLAQGILWLLLGE